MPRPEIAFRNDLAEWFSIQNANRKAPPPPPPGSTSSEVCPGSTSEMTGDELPIPVREFLERYISSIERLDILQLLVAEPAVAWTVSDVYRRVLSSVPSVEQQLRFFKSVGIVEEMAGGPATFRASLAGELQTAAAQTLACYKEMPVRVIRYIYDRKPEGPQGFADAFKLKQSDK